MTDKIKSCPFCGGEARFNYRTSSYDGSEMYGAECIQTGCCSIPPIYTTKEQAMTKWNTRKPMDRIVEQLEEVSFVETVEEYAEINLLLLDDAIEIVKAGGKDV